LKTIRGPFHLDRPFYADTSTARLKCGALLCRHESLLRMAVAEAGATILLHRPKRAASNEVNLTVFSLSDLRARWLFRAEPLAYPSKPRVCPGRRVRSDQEIFSLPDPGAPHPFHGGRCKARSRRCHRHLHDGRVMRAVSSNRARSATVTKRVLMIGSK
jgi:hypothetical protein